MSFKLISLLVALMAFVVVAHADNLIQVSFDKGLTTLVGELQTTGLETAINDSTAITLFGPTNDAFAALPELPTGVALENTLKYHVLSGGKYLAADFLDNNLNATLYDGNTVVINVRAEKIYANGVVVTEGNVDADNGVLHIVGSVLPVPAGKFPSALGGATTANFSTLVSLITVAGLATDLSGDAALTVFAPTDEAFAALPAYILTYLSGNVTALKEVLQYHVLATSEYASFLAAGTVNTLLGQTVDITVDGGVKVNNVAVTGTVYAFNGPAHTIGSVLVPPSNSIPPAPAGPTPTGTPVPVPVGTPVPMGAPVPIGTPIAPVPHNSAAGIVVSFGFVLAALFVALL